MVTFELFIHDDRYSVPTLQLVLMDDEAAALTAAEHLWQASSHHLGVEVCRGGAPVVALGACAERRRSDDDTPRPLRFASGG